VEDLSKHQLILIVLLITFVTSIATGIITFSLLQQAPVEVTQTINRVVERTIQQVASTADQPQKTVTTVVVNEDDSILSSISKVEKSIVRLSYLGSDGSKIFAGIGLVVSSNGIVVADSRSFASAAPSEVLFFDGKIYPTGKTYTDSANGLIFIKVNVPQIDNSNYVFSPVSFGNSDNLKIGQTLVAISGTESNAASVGRIFQLDFGDDKKTVTNIFSDIKISKSHFGSPALNLSGEVIGLEAPTSETNTEYSYIPVNVVKSATTKALTELAK
jgi:S1-C subfamily serine protease